MPENVYNRTDVSRDQFERAVEGWLEGNGGPKAREEFEKVRASKNRAEWQRFASKHKLPQELTATGLAVTPKSKSMIDRGGNALTAVGDWWRKNDPLTNWLIGSTDESYDGLKNIDPKFKKRQPK
jgi:hypothetical protein